MKCDALGLCNEVIVFGSGRVRVILYLEHHKTIIFGRTRRLKKKKKKNRIQKNYMKFTYFVVLRMSANPVSRTLQFVHIFTEIIILRDNVGLFINILLLIK